MQLDYALYLSLFPFLSLSCLLPALKSVFWLHLNRQNTLTRQNLMILGECIHIKNGINLRIYYYQFRPTQWICNIQYVLSEISYILYHQIQKLIKWDRQCFIQPPPKKKEPNNSP